MADDKEYDVVWEQAVSWMMRQHEEQLNEPDFTAMKAWLADPFHQKVYSDVRTLWLATGLIPSSEE